MRTSLAGSAEYSGKQFAWFQTPSEPGKGAHSKVLGILLPASATASCLCSAGLLLLALELHGVCELLHRSIFLVFAIPY